jgi:flagellar basal-body rod protein FlgF
MLTGLYSGATALDSLSAQQEAIASNLAHLNTPGHKRMMLSFSETMQGFDVENQRSQQLADFSQGRMQQTDRSLDFSVDGEGFFVFQGAQGEVYSRSGVVFLDADTNQLVDGNGLPILGENGPIEVTGNAESISVGSDGTLSLDAQTIGKLRLVQFDDVNLLESESQTHFRLGQATEVPPDNSKVQQGFRELSNAHPVTEMIALIVGSRNFEAAQRAIRMISDTMQETIRAQ